METQWKHWFCVATYCTKQWKRRFRVGTNGKRKENNCSALELIKNKLKTRHLRWNAWKRHRTHRFCVGTNNKRKENICFAWGPIVNVMKTYVLRGNIWATHEKHRFCIAFHRHTWENHVLSMFHIIRYTWENNGFTWCSVGIREKQWFYNVLHRDTWENISPMFLKQRIYNVMFHMHTWQKQCVFNRSIGIRETNGFTVCSIGIREKSLVSHFVP